MTPRDEMEAVLEAILFVAAEPLPRERLLAVFERPEQDEAAAALATVLERYRDPTDNRGVTIDEVAGGFRVVTRPELHSYLRRFFEASSKNKLSMAALETLAIVAYRQPATGPEIQELRGKSSSGVLKTLLERRLLRIAGRKEVVGKPFLYATTQEFLLHFGLHSLKDLPPLEEFEEALQSDGGFVAAAQHGAPLPDREEEILREAAAAEERDDADEDEDEDDASEEMEEEDEQASDTLGGATVAMVPGGIGGDRTA